MMGLFLVVDVVVLLLLLYWSIKNDSPDINGKVSGLFAYRDSGGSNSHITPKSAKNNTNYKHIK